MVVDDEEFCISAMKAMLTMVGIDTDNQVDFCIHGQEAVDKYIQCHNLGLQYGIIFMDFSMPVMDGIDATNKIQEYIQTASNADDSFKGPKIFGVTGHVLARYKDAGLKAGMDEILPKPLYANVLKEKLYKYNIL